MDTCLTRAFLDACHTAKRLLSYLPPLPDWMAPRQVHVIDAIYQLGRLQENVRPSDVARYLEGTMPSITRMLTTLEAHGAIERRPAKDDKRSHTLVLTPYGQELYDVHVAQFHEHLTELFADIPERDMFNTYNMGVGMSLVVDSARADEAVKVLKVNGEDAYIIGEITEGDEAVVIA